MKRLLIVAFFFCLIRPANALWQGHFDTSAGVSPIMIRELRDGQWLAGATKENIWHLDYQGASGSVWNGQRLHVGAFTAWNAEKGNPAYGPVIGIDLPAGVGHGIAALGSALNLDDTFKPIQYIDSALSFDFIGGYRPVHTPDTHSWVYGVGARLSVSFGVAELKKGL